MKLLKYFFQFIIISIFFLIFKLLGLKVASNFSSKIFRYIGPLFRSKKVIEQNILKAIPYLKKKDVKKINQHLIDKNAVH